MMFMGAIVMIKNNSSTIKNNSSMYSQCHVKPLTGCMGRKASLRVLRPIRFFLERNAMPNSADMVRLKQVILQENWQSQLGNLYLHSVEDRNIIENYTEKHRKQNVIGYKLQGCFSWCVKYYSWKRPVMLRSRPAPYTTTGTHALLPIQL